MNKAIFFDRDGCLIVDRHYLSDPDLIEFFPDTISALKRLSSHYQLFIVTNQSGIGRGLFTLAQMQRVHDKLLQLLAEAGIKIAAIAYCPHTPQDRCECRKPSPKLVNDLCSQFDIDPKNSLFIGDKLSDAQCGAQAKMQGCLLFTTDPGFPSFKNLSEFADYALKQN